MKKVILILLSVLLLSATGEAKDYPKIEMILTSLSEEKLSIVLPAKIRELPLANSNTAIFFPFGGGKDLIPSGSLSSLIIYPLLPSGNNPSCTDSGLAIVSSVIRRDPKRDLSSLEIREDTKPAVNMISWITFMILSLRVSL